MIRKPLLIVLFVAALLAVSAPSTGFAASGYSGAAAAAYADKYWQTYNTAWPSFANSGGDCTNFVSQALYAGGIAMRLSPQYSGNAAWYMVGSKHRWSYAAPWVNAQDNSIFALQHLPGVTQVATYYGVAPGQTVADNATQGDIVLYDFNNDGVYDHEAIVVANDGTGWDLVDAHTNNRYHVYWTLAQDNASWATTRIVVLHIPATTS
jgi:Putative amidase domain